MNQKLLYLSCILIIFLGCIGKKNGSKVVAKIPDLPFHSTSEKSVSKLHFLSKIDSSDFKFQSFSAKGTVNFNRNGDKHTADINIRLKKDEIIWFYINLSIIPVAQGYITPTEIRFKNLLTGDFTHKDFGYLQDLAGIPLRFQDIQSMLIGNSISSFLGDSTQFFSQPSGTFFLEAKKNGLEGRFTFNSQNRPILTFLQDSVRKRKVNLKYDNFLAQNGTFIPLSIRIQAEAQENTLEIQMDYRKIQFNPEQDYPFHSPDGSN